MDDIKLNRRRTRRVYRTLNAQYCFKNQLGFKDCTILNFSPTGASVKFDKNEKVNTGDTVFLEILIPQGFEHMSIKGIIKRIERRENEIIGGVKFNEKLKENIFLKL